MQAYLKKHGDSTAHHTVKIEWNVSGQEIDLEFTVSKRSSKPWQSDPVFTDDWAKNWGLWNKDVVEGFLQLRNSPDDIKAPYLEIQVSPLNQPFALIITEPRKLFHAPKALDFTHEVTMEGRSWKTKMKLTLPPELRGNLVYGGFFSCLDLDPREYYALEPNPEAAPDFHRPELFLPL